MPLLPNGPPLPGGATYNRLYDRVMECLGSETNTANFVIAVADLNAAKSRVSTDYALDLHSIIDILVL